ncbi:MAG: hypothetical protein IMW99_06325 [Firmicutes bacterium]|nr:hypothetical protein [Bacillota bacterium]
MAPTGLRGPGPLLGWAVLVLISLAVMTVSTVFFAWIDAPVLPIRQRTAVVPPGYSTRPVRSKPRADAEPGTVVPAFSRAHAGPAAGETRPGPGGGRPAVPDSSQSAGPGGPASGAALEPSAPTGKAVPSGAGSAGPASGAEAGAEAGLEPPSSGASAAQQPEAPHQERTGGLTEGEQPSSGGASLSPGGAKRSSGSAEPSSGGSEPAAGAQPSGGSPPASSALPAAASGSAFPGPAVAPLPRPAQVRGVFVTGWVAGSSQHLNRILSYAASSPAGINSVVVELKDDTGAVSYLSTQPLVVSARTADRKIADVTGLLRRLRSAGLFPIARIAVFKDSRLVRAHPEFGVRLGDGLYQDRSGQYWVDPYSQAVQDYNLALAVEAAKLGFGEIQFDYVRFPDSPQMSELHYPFANGRSRAAEIAAFLTRAADVLHRYHVTVAADIFGLVTTAQDDMGIGQYLETLAATPVDYLCPMVYPSHYQRGSYGIGDPESNPYDTVLHSLTRAQERLRAAGSKVRLVPWLQDFSLRVAYSVPEVEAQIRAARDAGIQEWMLWNPANRYTAGVRRFAPLPAVTAPAQGVNVRPASGAGMSAAGKHTTGTPEAQAVPAGGNAGPSQKPAKDAAVAGSM